MGKTREDVYRQFGPVLLEAIVILLNDELNVLRAEAGLPEKTHEDLLDGLDAKAKELPIPEWAKRDPRKKKDKP